MPVINGKYYSEQEIAKLRQVLSTPKPVIDSDFVTSAVVAAATGSSVIGALVGGDIVGGLLGDMLEGSGDSWF